MLVALYLLYRIAFPKPPASKQGNDIPLEVETEADDGVGKSRYVPTFRRQPRPTPATGVNSENQAEKPVTFAAVNSETGVAIPPEKLDEVFAEEPDPEDLDIPPDDENETDSPDLNEEAEELRRTLGGDAKPADGFTIEEMTEAVRNPSDENAGFLYQVEKTDMFEQMVSGDQGKRVTIKAVIDRHLQSLNPEAATEESDSDLEKFDVIDFLS
jgi:hypothetical protein